MLIFYFILFLSLYDYGFYSSSMLLIVIFGVRLFGLSGGKLRMDERIDLSMSDPDLVPLLIQVFFLIFFLNSMRILDSEGGY